MKVNGLRIGNIIEVDGEIQEVCELPLPENCTSDNTKGIPLTEDWLVKFGFEYHGVGGKWLTLFTPRGKALVFYDECYFKYTGVTIERPIIYVHQLQNLYFALTNTELKTNNL